MNAESAERNEWRGEEWGVRSEKHALWVLWYWRCVD
jgi:hypothetical protein